MGQVKVKVGREDNLIGSESRQVKRKRRGEESWRRGCRDGARVTVWTGQRERKDCQRGGRGRGGE